jgi:hypothetical protein
VLILEDAGIQAVDSLVPLAFCAESAQAEAGHGGIDLGGIGEAVVEDQERDPSDLTAVGILEREKAIGE